MAGIEAKVIQALLVQVDALTKGIETAGDFGRAKLADIKVGDVLGAIPQSSGKFDAGAWSKLGEDDQSRLHHRLTLVRDSLNIAAGLDGPRDPKHIMYAEYASNTAIVVWMSVGVLLTAVLLAAIVSLWSQATGTDFAQRIQDARKLLAEAEAAERNATRADAEEMAAQRQLAAATNESERTQAQQLVTTRARNAGAQRDELQKTQQKFLTAAAAAIQRQGANEQLVLAMVILLGGLGGALHLVGSLVKYVGNRQLKRSWLPHYLAMPIIGAALAPMVYMLLRVGLVNPSAVSGDGSAIANLNLIAIYAFAALTGLFAKTATEKLSEVFSTLFRTGEPASKDALGGEKPPGVSSAAAGKP